MDNAHRLGIGIRELQRVVVPAARLLAVAIFGARPSRQFALGRRPPRVDRFEPQRVLATTDPRNSPASGPSPSASNTPSGATET